MLTLISMFPFEIILCWVVSLIFSSQGVEMGTLPMLAGCSSYNSEISEQPIEPTPARSMATAETTSAGLL